MSDLALIPKQVEGEILAEVQSSAEFLHVLRCMPVYNEQDLEFVGRLMHDVKARHAHYDDQRKFFTAPLNKHVKDINAKFKQVLGPLEEAERILKDKIAQYHLKKQEEDKAKLLEVAAGKADVSALVVTQTVPSRTTVIEYWDYEVVDEDKVPRWALTVSEDAVKGYIDEAKGEPAPVAGLKFVKKARVVSR